MWKITEEMIEAIAIGAGILGTGGGGNPYIGMLRLRSLLQEGRTVQVVSPAELPEDALVVICAGIGAPTVGVEKLEQGHEGLWALRGLEREMGRKVTAVISAEIGGANSIEPMVVSALAGLPVVDGDGMGRAFPEVQMVTFFIYGVSPVPGILCDEKGNQVVIRHALDAVSVERFARAVTIQMGCTATMASSPMTAVEVQGTAVPYTLSLVRAVGEAVLAARRTHTDPIEAILEVTGGTVLFRGKIVDVERRTVTGFARGEVNIEGLDADRGQQLNVRFQNENLIAVRDGQVIACVPDLICIVDRETGEPVTTELLRFGQRVAVLGIPCASLLRQPEALPVVGPAAFGYDDVTYQPLPGEMPLRPRYGS
ncbi:MAG: DUF917 domain-containing protein [Candidatus Bipolaricaulia bacterium]